MEYVKPKMITRDLVMEPRLLEVEPNINYYKINFYIVMLQLKREETLDKKMSPIEDYMCIHLTSRHQMSTIIV